MDDLQKQRDETIEKLKVATKYNSTQELLEKYAGESPKQSPSTKPNTSNAKQAPSPRPPVGRTGLPPPPTANIVQPPVHPPSPPEHYGAPPPQQFSPPPNQSPNPPPPQTPKLPVNEPEFAPNAFPTGGQYIEQPHWYDRLLDVLLGEDEMQPRNRMAMICSSCRLVNGQAPPGIKTPEELGRWRCGSCGAWNGEESETTQILSSLRQNAGHGDGGWDHNPNPEITHSPEPPLHDEPEDAADEDIKPELGSEVDETPTGGESVEESTPGPVRRSTRGKSKQ